MLSDEQQKWINHLSDTGTIKIIPFDSTCEDKFQKIKERIQKYLGEEISVEHCGASALGISGQDEIDTYIPVSSQDFDTYVHLLKKLFGEPKSCYPLERARFVTEEEGKHIDVFVINKEGDGWKNSVIFHRYLRSHSEALEGYRILKENLAGKSAREYYREKILFINEILEKAQLT
jgi:GrpB-like predicted nucleotidyltransferase (UPF0157 family)